jgi:hypothetical protein
VSRAGLRVHRAFGAVVCILHTTLAAAAGTDGDTRLTYRAAGEGCPSEETYRNEARARIPAQVERGRRLDVRLGPSADGFEGTVEAIEPRAGASTVVASRTVAGATCQEVADATLLLVALGVLEAPPPDARREVPPPPRAIEPEPRAAPAIAFHVAGIALAASGFGPPALGGGARVGIGVERVGLFRPELRAGVDVVADAELRDSIGTAARSLIAGRLDACPIAMGTRLSLRPCASGALGEIRVRGVDVPAPRDERRLHGALGALVRGRAGLVGGLSAELSVGVLVPLLAHRFYFEPNATLFRMDSAVFMVEGGLSWSIP